MKKNVLFLTFLALCFSTPLFSQADSFTYNGNSIIISEKITQHFSPNYITMLKTNSPNHLLYLNYLVQNSFTIEDVGQKANNATFQNISNLTKSQKSLAPNFNITNPSSFNILAYEAMPTNETQVYLIGTSNQAIIISSKKIFIKSFNQYKANLLN